MIFLNTGARTILNCNLLKTFNIFKKKVDTQCTLPLPEKFKLFIRRHFVWLWFRSFHSAYRTKTQAFFLPLDGSRDSAFFPDTVLFVRVLDCSYLLARMN